jgi:hypothetical protein
LKTEELRLRDSSFRNRTAQQNHLGDDIELVRLGSVILEREFRVTATECLERPFGTRAMASSLFFVGVNTSFATLVDTNVLEKKRAATVKRRTGATSRIMYTSVIC